MSSRRRNPLIGIPILALMVACYPPVGQDPGGGPVVHPGGTAVVVRVESTGGLVPYEMLFTALPQFTLVGDGRVIVLGPVSDVYPGPALPNVIVRKLTENGIQSVIYQVTATGFFEESESFNGAAAMVADAHTTVFTLRADSREVVTDVYALGLLAEGVDLPPEITDREIEAHETLSALEADLLDLESWIPADHWAEADWQPYEPQAFRLLVTNIDDVPPIPEEGEPKPWPGSTPPEEIGELSEVQNFRCGLVMGDEAHIWYAALQEATQLTRWEHDGHMYRVTPRPLLPDETLDCGPVDA